MDSTVTLALMTRMICCTARLMTARPSVGSSNRAATSARYSKSASSRRTAMLRDFLPIGALQFAALDDGQKEFGLIDGFGVEANRLAVNICLRVHGRRRLKQRVPATLGGVGQRGGPGRRRLIEARAQARCHAAVVSAISRMGERVVPALANRQAHAASVLASRESFSRTATRTSPEIVEPFASAITRSLRSISAGMVRVTWLLFGCVFFAMSRMIALHRIACQEKSCVNAKKLQRIAAVGLAVDWGPDGQA